MSNIDDDITLEIKLEGPPTDDTNDKGGPTAFGISKVNNPDAWKNGPPTEAKARAIYLSKYVNGPGFDKIKDPQLQKQLIDFGVQSGPAIAIQKLQFILGTEVDGILGPQTLAAIDRIHPEDVNNGLMVERIKMICRIVTNNPLQLKFLNGWIDRSCQFIY